MIEEKHYHPFKGSSASLPDYVLEQCLWGWGGVGRHGSQIHSLGDGNHGSSAGEGVCAGLQLGKCYL